MFEVEGEIGVLKQDGRQVAGVYNWHSRIILQYTVKNDVREYKPVKTMTAGSYWLLEVLGNNEFEAELYKVVNGDLVVMESGLVRANMPDYKTLDRRLEAPIDMVWLGYEH